MKSKLILLLSGIVLLASCSTTKKVVTSPQKPRKKVVVRPVEKKTEPVKQIIKTPEVVIPQNTQDYILKYAPIAIKKMKTHKIPASITLAQGILESGSGRSDLAIRSNNHFGIKCHKGWEGNSVKHDDDEKGECFRKYKHPETSYEDHSKFLTSRKRYSNLFKLKITDYKGWAHGLRRAGYATDKRYPQKLIGLIQKYNLTQYDNSALPKDYSKVKVLDKVKGVYYQIEKGDTLYSIARKYGITVDKLKKLNKLTDNTISIGQQLLIE